MTLPSGLTTSRASALGLTRGQPYGAGGLHRAYNQTYAAVRYLRPSRAMAHVVYAVLVAPEMRRASSLSTTG